MSAIPNAGWFIEFYDKELNRIGDPIPFPEPAPFQYDVPLPEGAEYLRHVFIFRAPEPMVPRYDAGEQGAMLLYPPLLYAPMDEKYHVELGDPCTSDTVRNEHGTLICAEHGKAVVGSGKW